MGDALAWTVDAAWLDRVTRWAVVARYPTPDDGFVELEAAVILQAISETRLLLAEVEKRLDAREAGKD